MDKNRLLQIYIRLLIIHIQSFTTWTQFHKDTERAYEELFDIFHPIQEMLQAMGQEPTTDWCEDWQEAYDLIEEAKTIVEWLVKWNKDIWYDNLLRTKLENLNLLCGTFKQYTKEMEEEEEQEDITEETTEKLPIWQKLKPKY